MSVMDNKVKEQPDVQGKGPKPQKPGVMEQALAHLNGAIQIEYQKESWWSINSNRLVDRSYSMGVAIATPLSFPQLTVFLWYRCGIPSAKGNSGSNSVNDCRIVHARW
jgi:hypothetical protein